MLTNSLNFNHSPLHSHAWLPWILWLLVLSWCSRMVSENDMYSKFQEFCTVQQGKNIINEWIMNRYNENLIVSQSQLLISGGVCLSNAAWCMWTCFTVWCRCSLWIHLTMFTWIYLSKPAAQLLDALLMSNKICHVYFLTMNTYNLISRGPSYSSNIQSK